MSDKYKMKKGKNFEYPAYLRPYEVSQSEMNNLLKSMPEKSIDLYMEDLGLLGRASDIRNAVTSGRLKMYTGMPEDAYNALYANSVPSEQNVSSRTAGYYVPRIAATDTARVMINPLNTGGLDVVPHELGHEILGHGVNEGARYVGDVPKTPDLTKGDKLDRTLRGWSFNQSHPKKPIGGFKSKADSLEYNQIYHDHYHPETTDRDYKEKFADEWFMNMSQGTRLKANMPEMFEKRPMPSSLSKPKQAIRSVRGWLQQNVPWISKGEGWLPDDIYKKGSWFGL